MENIYLSSISTFLMGVFVLLFEYFVIIPISRRTELQPKKSDNVSLEGQQVIKSKIPSVVNNTIYSAFLWFINIVSFLVLLFAVTRLKTLVGFFSDGLDHINQFEQLDQFINIFSDKLLLASLYCVLAVFSFWVPCASLKEEHTDPLFGLFHLVLGAGLMVPILSILANIVFCSFVITLDLNLLYTLKPLGGIFFCVYILAAVINYLKRRMSNPKTDPVLTN